MHGDTKHTSKPIKDNKHNKQINQGATKQNKQNSQGQLKQHATTSRETANT